MIPPEDVIEPRATFERATTQLERSFGPSCLLSLIIVFLLVVILKRYMQLPWMMLIILVSRHLVPGAHASCALAT